MDEICEKLKLECRCSPRNTMCNGREVSDSYCCNEYTTEKHRLVLQQALQIGRSSCKLIEVKSDSLVFQVHFNNKKNFDLRTDDRNYCVGDILLQREFDRTTQMYSGREFVCRILSLLRGPAYDLPEEKVILSLHPSTIKTTGNLIPIFR